MFHLLAEPEAFYDVQAGTIHEEYVLDGRTIEFHLGGEGIVFPGLVLHLHKTPENQVLRVDLDLMNLRGSDLKRIVQSTGTPDDLEGINDDESVLARFTMKSGPIEHVVQPGLQQSESLGEFLDWRDEAGLPVFFDFDNYRTDGVLSS